MSLLPHPFRRDRPEPLADSLLTDGRPGSTGARSRSASRLRITSVATAVSIWAAFSAGAQALPPVPVPAANPITSEKAVLGKILFWDQQLSSDNTVACGTCHAPSSGGMDPVAAEHPGADGIFGNADDVTGSFGVVRRDVNGDPISDPLFGFEKQVTGRAAQNFFGGLWDSQNFWDGRAGSEFRDPLTDVVVIGSGGALENQALGPILSTVEMAKDGRTWADVISRLEFSPPLGLASSLPADVTAAIATDPTYPDLFEAAFGDSVITPVRIAFAIATYERTLVPDQTPFDAFEAGDTSALTPQQQQGLQFMGILRCNQCHTPPIFSNDDFQTIGVRSPSEDDGRQSVTGDPEDRGAFKSPTLRNVALKPNFMHTGEFTTLEEVIDFYGPNNQDPENLDPLMPIDVPNSIGNSIIAFMTDGLTDPRVAAETAPFDRPILAPEPGFAVGILLGVGTLAGRVRRRREGSLVGSRTSSPDKWPDAA